jgi:hypothetical protein
VPGDVALIEVAHSPGNDAGDAPVGAGGDFRRRCRATEEQVEERGRAPAQHRPVTTGQNGGHVAGLDAGRLVAEPVHAEMLAMQQPLLNSPLNRPATEAGVEQLASGHNAMLPGRDSGNLSVR